MPVGPIETPSPLTTFAVRVFVPASNEQVSADAAGASTAKDAPRTTVLDRQIASRLTAGVTWVILPRRSSPEAWGLLRNATGEDRWRSTVRRVTGGDVGGRWIRSCLRPSSCHRRLGSFLPR